MPELVPHDGVLVGFGPADSGRCENVVLGAMADLHRRHTSEGPTPFIALYDPWRIAHRLGNRVLYVDASGIPLAFAAWMRVDEAQIEGFLTGERHFRDVESHACGDIVWIHNLVAPNSLLGGILADMRDRLFVGDREMAFVRMKRGHARIARVHRRPEHALFRVAESGTAPVPSLSAAVRLEASSTAIHGHGARAEREETLARLERIGERLAVSRADRYRHCLRFSKVMRLVEADLADPAG